MIRGRREGEIDSQFCYTKSESDTWCFLFPLITAFFFLFLSLSSVDMEETGSNQIEVRVFLAQACPTVSPIGKYSLL